MTIWPFTSIVDLATILATMAQAQQVQFAVVLAAQLGLVLAMLLRQGVRRYPAFFFYALANLLEGPALYFVYRELGFDSPIATRFATVCDGIVLICRAAAVAELCRVVLSRFAGVWALAWRVLACAATVLAAYSLFAAGWNARSVVSLAEVGLEFTIATVLTLFVVFTRYYGIETAFSARTLAIGFFLLSYSNTLINFVLLRYLLQYGDLWSVLRGLTYIASAVAWMRALWPIEVRPGSVELLPAETYGQIMPSMNLRLRLLNARLSRFFQPEAEQS